MITMPIKAEDQRGRLFTGEFDQLPTRKMQAVSLPGPPAGFTSGHELWGGSIVPPTPTIRTAVADPELHTKIQQYMRLNVQSGFSPQETVRLAQGYGEALIRERWPLSPFLSSSVLEDIARTINQVSQELEISPEGCVNASP